MSARFEITCDDDTATITAPGGVTDSFSRSGTSTDRFGYAAIRQQQSDLAALTAECDQLKPRMTNARHHGCAFDGWQCYHCGEVFTTMGGARTHFGHESDAMPGCIIKVKPGDERGLLIELRKAEAERDQLRARLAAVDAAPTVARVVEERNRDFACGPYRYIAYGAIPQGLNELIARPAKDGRT